MDQPRPAVYVDPATGRASGPMREKFHSYLGVVAREKVPIIHNNWKDVPETLKELVWNDIIVSPHLCVLHILCYIYKVYLYIDRMQSNKCMYAGKIWYPRSRKGEDEGYVNGYDEMAAI